MDDPLVGLTIYESKLTRNIQLGLKNSTNKDRSTNKKDIPNCKAAEKAKNQTKKTTKRRKNSDSTQSIAGGSRKSSQKLGGECFACLPGIEDEEEEEMSLSSDSEVASHVHTAGGHTPMEAHQDPTAQEAGVRMNSPVPPAPKNFWLMRLFQSNLFDMSIAIGYLFNSKEEDVQAYLGNKLFVSGVYVQMTMSVLCQYQVLASALCLVCSPS